MQSAAQPDSISRGVPFRARFSAMFRAAPGAGRTLARDVVLKQVIADLDRLNHQTEQDFLLIGGRLAEFVGAVKLISSELAALTNLIEGEHGLRAAEALTGALGRSTEMRTHAEEGNALLATMRAGAGRLKRTLCGFEGTLSTFRTLGVLTRIETTRLGSKGADFGNLADDVKSLAGNVRARVESALDTAALLIPPIEKAIQDIAALEGEQVRDLPAVISEVLESLAAFHETQEKAQQASVRLAAQSGAIAEAFGTLIVSVQFHDITRQQVEHVMEVLARLCSEPGRPDAAAILALQSSQLQDAGEKFAASVAQVARSLDGIATHVQEMAEESRTLAGLSGDDKSSFFLKMEQGYAAILGSLGQCSHAEGVTQATSGGMAATIGRMHGAIEEIEAMGIQVQRMSLNASLRAAHIGASGDALGVLAGAMQTLASDCAERSVALVEALGSMSGAAARLSGNGRPEREAEGSDLEAMRAAVAGLHSSSEDSFACIASIGAHGARLRDDVATARSSFSVGAVFAEAVGRARAMLGGIEADEPSGRSLAGSSHELTDFSRHYTMQAERDVHEGITGAGAAADLSSLEAGEMGSNVELF